MNWKYILFDLFKVIIPLLIAHFLPETAPQAAIIESLLYALALALGVDSVQKNVRTYKAYKIAKVK